MLRLVRCRNHAGDRRVRDDPFQKKLRPGSTIELGRPIGQCFRADATEKIASAEWTIDDDGNRSILGQRQDALLGFALHQRVINLEKIQLLTP